MNDDDDDMVASMHAPGDVAGSGAHESGARPRVSAGICRLRLRYIGLLVDKAFAAVPRNDALLDRAERFMELAEAGAGEVRRQELPTERTDGCHP